ncbi:MAG TPA: HIRAN domain-containing protein [Mycobacteriales bacterium]|nr:HIRAN domain-containing protein [Mycobacteriales bacterium]
MQRAATPVRVVDFSALNYRHRLEIRGESFHLSALRQLQRQSDSWPARLVREPHNQYDRNAIAVHIRGRIVGHVAREQAAELASTLDAWGGQGVMVEFDATLCGGTRDKPNIGVFINN